MSGVVTFPGSLVTTPATETLLEEPSVAQAIQRSTTY
jgi:hypothetical protein